jgi:AraC-like DNA-binding protein
MRRDWKMLLRGSLAIMAEVIVRFAIPSEPLRPFISTYYELEICGEGSVQDMLHPEWANIRVPLNRGWEFGLSPEAMTPLPAAIVMQGPTSRATHIKGPKGISFGIGILPTGWSMLFRADASSYADRIRPLLDLLGEEEAEALFDAITAEPNLEGRAKVADAWITAKLNSGKRKPFDGQVESLFQVLIDPASATVEQITATLGLPQHQLVRLSRRGFGFPPKLLLRRQRFLRMLGTLHARPYEEWNDFLDPQYVDQSHMIRDFNRFLGMPPSRYFQQPRAILAAAAKARAAMFGQPLQGLHPAKPKNAR